MSGRPLTDDFAGAIGSVFEEKLFRSSKMVSTFRIGRAARLRILHEKLGLNKFHLRGVPHVLSINQKSETASHSKLLLTALMEEKASGFQWIITENESWFVFDYRRDSVWAV
jgi:hypothetical protein